MIAAGEAGHGVYICHQHRDPSPTPSVVDTCLPCTCSSTRENARTHKSSLSMCLLNKVICNKNIHYSRMGKSLDLSEKELQDFIVQQQEFEREERRSAREARKNGARIEQ